MRNGDTKQALKKPYATSQAREATSRAKEANWPAGLAAAAGLLNGRDPRAGRAGLCPAKFGHLIRNGAHLLADGENAPMAAMKQPGHFKPVGQA